MSTLKDRCLGQSTNPTSPTTATCRKALPSMRCGLGSLRLLGSRFFNELQGRGAPNRTTPRPPVLSEARHGFRGLDLGAPDDAEQDLEPEFLDLLVSQEDRDALLVAGFEGELEEYFQKTPEMHSALISYMDARNRLKEKQRSRDFWPVMGSRQKGAKGFLKGGKGFKGKRSMQREALLQRIAKSRCRNCGEKGRRKAECPKLQPSGTKSACRRGAGKLGPLGR